MTPNKSRPLNRNVLQIVSRIEHPIYKEKLFTYSSKIGVTISGGQDSIFLLFCLSFLQSRLALSFFLIWCNHFWQSYSFYTTLHLAKSAYAFSYPILHFIPLHFYRLRPLLSSNTALPFFFIRRFRPRLFEKPFYSSSLFLVRAVPLYFTLQNNGFAKKLPLLCRACVPFSFAEQNKNFPKAIALHYRCRSSMRCLRAPTCVPLLARANLLCVAALCPVRALAAQNVQIECANRMYKSNVQIECANRRFAKQSKAKQSGACPCFAEQAKGATTCPVGAQQAKGHRKQSTPFLLYFAKQNKRKITACKCQPLFCRAKEKSNYPIKQLQNNGTKKRENDCRNSYKETKPENKAFFFTRHFLCLKKQKRFIEPLSESLARNWRHITIERTCSFYNASCSIYGHTLSDRVETILFNLIRGSGGRGATSFSLKRRHSSFSYNKFYPGLKSLKKKLHL